MHERLRPEKLRVLSKDNGLAPLTVIDRIAQLPEASKILQDGEVRERELIDLAALLNSQIDSQNLDFSNTIRELPALGPWRMVTITTYSSIRDAFKVGLERFVLQKRLAKKIGHVLTSEGKDWQDAALISRPHNRPKPNHTAIAKRDIAATFDEFMPQLTSVEGVPATDFTVDLIHTIMTNTVFGGYHDPEVASWKEPIIYFLQHLIEVQQSYAVGSFAEGLPKKIQRKLMRSLAEKQGVSDVLENMFKIEDDLFPRIIAWIKKQEDADLSDEQLAKMGFLGAALSAKKAGRPMDMTRADIFGIYTAALDSTANAVNWLLSEFAQHPEILRKVASLEGEERKKYVQFIVFELWRKDTITPIIFRQVPAQDEVLTDRKDEQGVRIKKKVKGKGRTMPDGTFLPRNTVVLLSPGAAGRDPVRFPNPDDFNPDRYYAMTEEEIEQVEADLDLVFAGDKHKCQGQSAVGRTMDALINYMANRFDSINLAPAEDGQAAVPGSNYSGVRSPVDQYGKALNLRVVPKYHYRRNSPKQIPRLEQEFLAKPKFRIKQRVTI